MTILFIRHAHAGERGRWHDDDRARPVSEKGVAQSQALVDLHAEAAIDRIITSPYTRCVQTVEPLAEARGLELERSDVLAEGVDRAALATLLDGLVGQDVALCSHGDVLDATLRLLGSRGVDLGDDLRYQKGSTWVLEDDGDRIVHGRYVEPPRI